MVEDVKRVLVLVLAVFLASGCGRVFMPYSSEFQCPEPYQGECISIPGAYDKVIQGYDPPDTMKEAEKRRKEGKVFAENRTDLRSVYESLFLETVAGMLEKPEVPIVTPVKIMRMLILPYTDPSGTVYLSPHYVYFIVENPRFILDVRKMP